TVAAGGEEGRGETRSARTGSGGQPERRPAEPGPGSDADRDWGSGNHPVPEPGFRAAVTARGSAELRCAARVDSGDLPVAAQRLPGRPVQLGAVLGTRPAAGAAGQAGGR